MPLTDPLIVPHHDPDPLWISAATGRPKFTPVVCIALAAVVRQGAMLLGRHAALVVLASGRVFRR